APNWTSRVKETPSRQPEITSARRSSCSLNVRPPPKCRSAWVKRCSSRRSRWPVGKLRVLSGQEACAILERHGFARVRQRGSHVAMQRVTAEGTTTVPVPDHTELRTGTLRSIIRQSGLPRSEFEV